MAVPAWRAVYDLVVRPHFWGKTPHGEADRNLPPWFAVMVGGQFKSDRRWLPESLQPRRLFRLRSR